VSTLASLLDLALGLPGRIIAVSVLVVVLFRSLKLVEAHETYVVTDGDGVAATLEPGLNVVSPLSFGNERVDRRTHELTLPLEAVETADGVPVDVTVFAEMRVSDAAAAVSETDDYRPPPGSDAADFQLAFSERTGEVVTGAVGDRSLAELSDDTGEFEAHCRRAVERAAESFGVTVETFAIESVERIDRAEEDDGTATRDGTDAA